MSTQLYYDQFEPLSPEQIVELMHLTADDDNDLIMWQEDTRGRLFFYVRCDDLFVPGSADAQMITVENFNSLKETINELQEKFDAPEMQVVFMLWCCRQRKSRPESRVYGFLSEDVHELFDACGPERDL